MKGNDLSNAPTRRFWVISDVVLVKDTQVTEKKRWWGSTKTEKHEVTVPDMAALSLLWRWANALEVRLELLFVGDTSEAPMIWDMLEKSAANPFNDWLAFETFSAVAERLPYRPDLMGVLDTPERSAVYGGKGMTIREVW